MPHAADAREPAFSCRTGLPVTELRRSPLHERGHPFLVVLGRGQRTEQARFRIYPVKVTTFGQDLNPIHQSMM